MERQRQLQSGNMKNPAVWRKTGHPEMYRGGIGKNKIQSTGQTMLLPSRSEAPHSDHRSNIENVFQRVTVDKQADPIKLK